MAKIFQYLFSMKLLKLSPIALAVWLPAVGFASTEVDASVKGATAFLIDNRNNDKYYVEPQSEKYDYQRIWPTVPFYGKASERVNVGEKMTFHIYDKFGAFNPVKVMTISSLPGKRNEPISADEVYDDGEGKLTLEVTLKKQAPFLHKYEYKFVYKKGNLR